MSQVVQTVLDEAKKNKLKIVTKVTLDVGELSFLGEEALKFCYQALSKDNILTGSELTINIVKPVIKCDNCSYQGELEYLDDESFHYRLPQFTCPKCNKMVKIIEGKGCIIKEITGEIED
jgi:hydrogenase nickel incorporation protein HypA/HybF